MASAAKALIRKNEHGEQGVHLDVVDDRAHLKDTNFSWFVCACTFISQVFVLGVLHAFGVFFVEFVREFNSPKGEAAWIGSLAYGLSMTFGPVTSLMISRFGYSRVMMAGGVTCAASLVASSFANSIPMLFFTFSVLYGIGCCMSTSPTMTIVGDYFDRHLSVATGITVSGSSFGTLVMGPLSQLIIDHGGWRLAFRVFAALALVTVVLNSRIRPLTPVGTVKRQKRNILHDLQIWKNRVFVIWTLSITLVMFGFYIPYVHLVSYALDQGISQDKASILMMILGATTAIGRLAFGRIVQIGMLNRLHMHQLSMLVTGTGVMMLPIIKSYAGIVMYVITVGVVDGCYVVLLPILTTSLVGIENSVLAWGFMIGTCSITFTLGPPVAGALYDYTGSYNIAFHLAGIPIVAGAILLFFIPWAQRTSGTGHMLNILHEYTVADSGDTIRGSDSRGTVCDDTVSIAISTCSKCSHVTVRTTGTNPMSIRPRAKDQATSTDDEGSARYFSLDIDDALSQLSYSDRVFVDMLRRQSRDSAAGSHMSSAAADTSSSTQSIPRILPPSEHMRNRHPDGSRHGSVHSGASSIRDRPLTPSSRPLDQATAHLDAAGSILASYVPQSTQSPSIHSVSAMSSYDQLGSLGSEGMLSSGLPALSTGPSQSTDPLNIMQSQAQTKGVDNALASSSQGPIKESSSSNKTGSLTTRSDRLRSPSPAGPSSNSPAVSMKDPVKDLSNFDETIHDQVTILRETLRSPDQVDSKISKDLQTNVTTNEVQQYRINTVQDAKHLGLPLPPKIKCTSPTPEPSPTVSKVTSPPLSIPSRSTSPSPSLSEDKLLLPSVPKSDPNQPELSSSPQPGTSKSQPPQPKDTALLFANNDNQITVIPGTNPFKDKNKAGLGESGEKPRKLEDLFKSISEEAVVTGNESFEVLDPAASEEVVKTKSAGELDVFKHLFTDEESESQPKSKD